ncbi:type I-E CRISPR-associated protein Cas5/CasD [Streptomyces sp. NPDC056257]|uniref:type I-E CRISPR-associated protein Cas5/CasD n=1 Tax=Streptomyces sp. NPDC056257 TaxID=3345765 RepID=UPI0035DC9ED9
MNTLPTTPKDPPPPGAHGEGLLLRLTGPLQSWGTHSHFNERDTAAFPTLSGVLGLLACALGRPRHAPTDDLARLSLTVRVDRPGVVLRDLHTVGGGLPPKATVSTAEGKKRGGDTTTLLSHRTYLADAAFTCAVTGRPGNDADTRLITECAQALRLPRWPLYLGRRSCPPEGPLLLGQSAEPLRHLVDLPVAAHPPRTADTSGRSDRAPHMTVFLSDRPLGELPPPQGHTHHGPDTGAHPTSTINDLPSKPDGTRRTYRSRPLYRRTLPLPPTQFHGLGTTQLTALTTYMSEHLTPPNPWSPEQ